MNKVTNTWLWNVVFVGIMMVACSGVYFAADSIDYTWRWSRMQAYIVDTTPKSIYAEQDGVVEISDTAGSLSIVPYEGGEGNQYAGLEGIIVADGDSVFAGDEISRIEHWQLGPISQGLIMTLKLSMVSIVFAIIIGLFVGLMRISANPALKNTAIVYVELIRGTPLLVQIFIFYFFIGTVLQLDRFTAGVCALSVFSGAYVAEIIRSGINAIPKGQMEAARSLGMNYVQAMIYIILPQAIKRTLPPMAGQFINLIKDSSLVSVIAITDLTKAGREVVSSTFAPFEVWFTVALMYLVLTGGLSWIIQKFEKRLAISD